MVKITDKSVFRRLASAYINNARRDFQRLLLADHPFYIVAMGLMCLFMEFVVRPWPKDDLLRNMVAFADHYDYGRMFVYSPGMPRYDFDIGFDRVCGFLYRSMPWWHHAAAVHLVQCLAFITYVSSLLFALRRVLGLSWIHERSGWGWLLVASLLFAVMNCGALGRCVSGRQEVFLSAWAIAVMALPAWWAALIWLGVGVVLAPCYWLSIVYAPAALLLAPRFGWGRAMIFFSILVLVNFAFWHWYSAGDWLPSIMLLRSDIAHRVIAVSEDQPLAILLMVPWFWVLLIPFIGVLWKRFLDRFRGDNGATSLLLLAVIVWFALPDMVRYEDVLAGFMALFAAGGMRVIAREWPGIETATDKDAARRPWYVVKGLVVAFLVFSSSATGGVSRPPVFRFRHPSAHIVLTPWSSPMYQLVFANPGVRVAPAMELGATSHGIQKMSVDLSDGHISCSRLRQTDFTNVYEKSLSRVPPCLKLAGIAGPMRMWSVR
jgi:hypothetical protein